MIQRAADWRVWVPILVALVGLIIGLVLFIFERYYQAWQDERDARRHNIELLTEQLQLNDAAVNERLTDSDTRINERLRALERDAHRHEARGISPTFSPGGVVIQSPSEGPAER